MTKESVPEIVQRRGGWFVTGENWSGPWRTEEAAREAMFENYAAAHRLNAPDLQPPCISRGGGE